MLPDQTARDLELDTAVKTKQQQFLEQSIYRWRFLLDGARAQLHAQNWTAAANAYQDAHGIAEFLIHIADCKNCAIKNYMRTLIEYGYSLCKNDQLALLSRLIDLARKTLDCYTTPTLAQQLLKPILALEKASQRQRDMWINQLFASDAVQQGVVH